MESNKFLEMLSAKSSLGENYFHEACKSGSMALFIRAGYYIDRPMPSLLREKNNNGEQCTHIIVKNNDSYATDIMEAVLILGADINGQETVNGFTPLHLCVSERNYDLAEWLCKRPDIDLEAINHEGQTAYQLASKLNDPRLMEILKAAGAKSEPSNRKKRVNLASERNDPQLIEVLEAAGAVMQTYE